MAPMENYGLVIHDDQSFLAKVVELGVQLGALTSERADEIIRISVAMANKYVLQKEIDFRSVEQLARVQQTILRLVGVGLEIKSKGDVDQGIDYISDSSPVDLFRLAYTRIENLRNEWKKLLLNHKIQILVNQEDYECLSEMACQILGEMNVFTEAELYTIRSITLDDDLFTSLAILEYYESELRRYQFILKLKDILPFDMLNRSPLVKAENLSEVDSIREALINTLVISGYVETESPIAVSINDIRQFLESVDWSDIDDPFPVEIETPVIEVIHELGQGLDENEASLLAKEVIRSIQKLVTTIVNDWKTVNSNSIPVFFKRWSRIALLSDKLDELEQLITPSGRLDEFEFENLVEKIVRLPELEITNVIDRLPWDSLSPDQVIRLFHDFRPHQKKFIDHVSLGEFSGPELIDLIEIMETGTLKIIIPKIKDVLANLSLELEDLEILASVPEIDVYSLLRVAAPPQLDKGQALLEFVDGGSRTRKILFHSCVRADFFPDFFLEVWSMDPQFVKREIRALSTAEIGPFIRSVSGSITPKLVYRNKKEFDIEFMSNELSSFYNSLPATKKKAVIKFFSVQDK